LWFGSDWIGLISAEVVKVEWFRRVPEVHWAKFLGECLQWQKKRDEVSGARMAAGGETKARLAAAFKQQQHTES
jgi:hypothetical protein